MKKFITILILVCALNACTSTTATRRSDGSILIAKRGSVLKTFPEDITISGAAAGKITPASKLKVTRKTYIKGGFVRNISCEGYVDLSKPGWIEMRLVRSDYQGNFCQMNANGKHRLETKPTLVE